MTPQWSKLREWGGSLQKAFEQLCCQLAEAEPTPTGSKFKRKGTPDGGVECYWTMPDGEEWAWQAKFFFQMHEPQWRDLDDSVNDALSKHSRLVRYYVCIPLDLADPRLSDKTTKKRKTFAQDAWNLRVRKWEAQAAALGKNVQFEYWGDHEIWTRLSFDENAGSRYFWFDERCFSEAWLRHRLEDAYENAGRRYLPALHVGLDLEHAFEALGRGNEFFRRFSEQAGAVRRQLDLLRLGDFDSAVLQESATNLNEVVRKLIDSVTTARSTVAPLPLTEVERLAKRGEELTFELAIELGKCDEDETNPAKADNSYKQYRLSLLQDRFVELRNFAESPEARVADTGVLLLVGDAGTGKTHLLCEVARKRIESGAPTVLLLGEQFEPGDPWTHLIEILGLNCDRDTFLGALESAAQAQDTRAMILLDGLNEEHGWEIWPKYLAGMLSQIKRYPRISVALSVRSTYENLVVPTQVRTHADVVRYEHQGFAGHEEQAVDRYFEHYGITLPTSPILDPEFSNPLFLRVLCESLKNKGLPRIPEGVDGFNAVFDFFLDSINEKLARRESLNYDPQSQIVRRAVGALVTAMVAEETDWVHRESARETLDAILPRPGYDRSLFKCLVDEGVLSQEFIRVHSVEHRSSPATRTPVVRFQYQRFADHIIVEHLLTPHIEAGQPSAAFADNTFLGKSLADPVATQHHQGLVEALAVILPERIGIELPKLVPKCASYDSVKKAVSASLSWRRSRSISSSTWTYIQEHVLPDRSARRILLQTLILVSPDPAHPYNALFLHDWLYRMHLTDRDALWSCSLATDYASGGASARLLRWTESIAAAPHFEEQAMMLTARGITWFLTSSNRLLRDRATKALVTLLSRRLSMAGDLLEAFCEVNDAYVLERLTASAYGAAMRTRKVEDVLGVAAVCYEKFFKHNSPPLNALTRDYLRGILELAVHLEPSFCVQVERFRPPYGASLPDGFDPKQRFDPALHDAKAQELHHGLWSVHHSLTADDFESYILRPLCGRFLAARLGDPAPTRREACELFLQTLTSAQQFAWKNFRDAQEEAAQFRLQRMWDLLECDDSRTEIPQSNVEEALDQFESVLTSAQKEQFYDGIRPYLEHNNHAESRTHVGLGSVQHFILDRVFSLPWRQELDDFDRSRVISSGRNDHAIERIGKKYQWIAFYDLIGLLADNFQFTGDSYNTIEDYAGPWQITYGRNIDPSCLLRSKPSDEGRPCWWAPKAHDSWAEELEELAWLGLDSDMPSIDKEFLLVTEPGQKQWVVLNGFYAWTQPTTAGRTYLELPQRQIRYSIKSCLVHRKNAKGVQNQLNCSGISGTQFLEPRHPRNTFLGEMHWSPVYMSQLTPYYGYEGWTKDSLPRSVLSTSEEYFAERGAYDLSMDESVTLACPSHWIVEKMGLRWNGVEGEWCGGTPCRTVFRDPSAHAPGPTVLLALREDLERFLDAQDLKLIWIVTGTKWALGGNNLGHRPSGKRLIFGTLRYNGDRISGKVGSRLETSPAGNF